VPPGRQLLPAGPGAPRDAREELADELLDALACGMGDYFVKNRFKQIGIALSGGATACWCC